AHASGPRCCHSRARRVSSWCLTSLMRPTPVCAAIATAAPVQVTRYTGQVSTRFSGRDDQDRAWRALHKRRVAHDALKTRHSSARASCAASRQRDTRPRDRRGTGLLSLWITLWRTRLRRGWEGHSARVLSACIGIYEIEMLYKSKG